MALNPQSARGAIRSDINVTPLVDVCLVLLIIFMVVTPLIQAGVKVDLPKTAKLPSDAGQTSSSPSPIQEDGSVWVRGTRTAEGDLPGLLATHPRGGAGPRRDRPRRPPPPVREGLRGADHPERRGLHADRAGDGEEAKAG